MNKAREKRIKKFKKKNVWPSIVGLFVILLLSVIILVAAMVVSAVDVVYRKVNDSNKTSLKVAELFADYNADTASDIEQKVLDHIDILDDIKAVSVTDADKNPLWSSSGEYPDSDKAEYTDLVTNSQGEELGVIFVDFDQQAFVVKDDSFTIKKSALMKILFTWEFDDDVEFTSVNLWYVIPVNGMNVMVLDNIPVLYRDFLMMKICIALCAVVIVILVMYYLSTVISMAISVHKTAKILYTDMVTGGNNWLLFIKKGTSLLKKNKKGQLNYAMVHLGMRKYRSFCTCFGVNKGQELIESFYNVLRKDLKRKEIMAHQENSEFGLLLTFTDKFDLEARIRRIENNLSAVVPGMKMYFGVGVYIVNAGEHDVEQLYNNAMIACEMLSEENEDKIAYFDVEMNNQKLWERKVEDDMEKALANREFQVYLQPKISTNEEVIGGAEALVRWMHPTEGFISPNRFIPIFERNGFILKLDDYMLEEIARVQAQWLTIGKELIPISVNVSRAHFTREDLAEHICSIVDKYNVPHDVIELELTESAFFDDKKALLNTVQKLRSAGFKVSMDDFGAGYSSLNSLKELQIDVLKIDADFFRGADVEKRGLLIVSEVIDLAKKLNMKIVAEGIESKEQVEFLTAQECDLIQGYFYAKPMPVTEFAEKYIV